MTLVTALRDAGVSLSRDGDATIHAAVAPQSIDLYKSWVMLAFLYFFQVAFIASHTVKRM